MDSSIPFKSTMKRKSGNRLPFSFLSVERLHYTMKLQEKPRAAG